MGVLDRGGHQSLGFVGCITEHDPLVARTFVFVVGCIHALRDMCGLFVQKVRDLDGVPMEFVLLVTNVFDAVSGDLVDAAHVVGQLVLVA